MYIKHFVDTVGLAAWCLVVWVLVTWTATVEQAAFGIAVSVAVAALLAPLGPVAPPWPLLAPATAKAAAGLLVTSLGRIAVANVRLAARVWSPRRPLRSGMVIVPTAQRSELGLTIVGLVTSAVVDNQLVDLDRRRSELVYHAVSVPDGEPARARALINGPVERFLPQERQEQEAGS
jgi:multicomponent Na+:H+ antiporter subunit E